MEISFQAIQQMCNVCEESGCWHWKGAISANGTPTVSVGTCAADRKVVAVRKLVLDMLGEVPPVARFFPVASNTCANRGCVAPEHANWMTRKALQRRTAELTKYGASLTRRAKIEAAMRARSTLTMDVIREMRTSGMTPKQIADSGQYPVDRFAAAQILRGDIWKDHASPFAGLMR